MLEVMVELPGGGGVELSDEVGGQRDKGNEDKSV